MKYKRTAVITFRGGHSHGLQAFESHSPLTDERIASLVLKSGVNRGADVYIYDTPEPELVPRDIVAQVCQGNGHLYVGYSTDGEWGTFWQLPDEAERHVVMDIMIAAQRRGALDRQINRDVHWMGDTGDLGVIATYDGDRLDFKVNDMSDTIKTRLGFGSAK